MTTFADPLQKLAVSLITGSIVTGSLSGLKDGLDAVLSFKR